ncbi:hypothetical protein ACFLT1_04145 [Bacteroidota bacterium]
MTLFFTIAAFIIGFGPTVKLTYMNLTDPVEVINGTFLGNEERNYYGYGSPNSLDVVWKHNLGEGETIIGRKTGSVSWKGAGWTGQPLVIREGRDTFLIQGAYDHNLKKINLSNGELVWEHTFNDVIKGTGSFWHNRSETNKDHRYIILQGSRLGTHHYFDADKIYSYRAISYLSGEELWRHNVKRTLSYSRDVDASALIINDTAYIGLENSYFTVFNPDPDSVSTDSVFFVPQIYQQHLLYKSGDVISHGGNLVTEASPCIIGRMIYIASGSGHIWGYSMDSKKLEWDFFIGSDIDGSPVVTSDSCLLISIEKQYIKGKGGILKLDPSKHPDDAVQWFFPVKDSLYSSWEGGVIGSVGISDRYSDDHLAAFMAIDGNLYVVRHTNILADSVPGFDAVTWYKTPELVFSYDMGTSISTPVFTSDRLVACGYEGIYLFSYAGNDFELLDKKKYMVESTPFVQGNRVYIASRNGYLYCLGN